LDGGAATLIQPAVHRLVGNLATMLLRAAQYTIVFENFQGIFNSN
jgi:hypothetical protein